MITVGLTALTIAIVGTTLIAILASFGGALGESPETIQARGHFERGDELRKAGDHRAALAEYESSYSLDKDIYTLLAIANSEGALGAHEKAVAHFDEAIVMGKGWYQPFHDKARYLERAQGIEAAVAWFEGLDQSEGDPRKYQYLIGSLHMDAGRPALAIPRFEAALQAAMNERGISFDEDQGIIIQNEEHIGQNKLASLWPMPTYLARCWLHLGGNEKSYQYATMGISLHQRINTHKGYCSPEQIEAGISACRILRARVHMAQKELDAAQAELDHAATFEDGWSETRTAAAQTELDALRLR